MSQDQNTTGTYLSDTQIEEVWEWDRPYDPDFIQAAQAAQAERDGHVASTSSASDTPDSVESASGMPLHFALAEPPPPSTFNPQIINSLNWQLRINRMEFELVLKCQALDLLTKTEVKLLVRWVTEEDPSGLQVAYDQASKKRMAMELEIQDDWCRVQEAKAALASLPPVLGMDFMDVDPIVDNAVCIGRNMGVTMPTMPTTDTTTMVYSLMRGSPGYHHHQQQQQQQPAGSPRACPSWSDAPHPSSSPSSLSSPSSPSSRIDRTAVPPPPAYLSAPVKTPSICTGPGYHWSDNAHVDVKREVKPDVKPTSVKQLKKKNPRGRRPASRGTKRSKTRLAEARGPAFAAAQLPEALGNVSEKKARQLAHYKTETLQKQHKPSDLEAAVDAIPFTSKARILKVFARLLRRVGGDVWMAKDGSYRVAFRKNLLDDVWDSEAEARQFWDSVKTAFRRLECRLVPGFKCHRNNVLIVFAWDYEAAIQGKITPQKPDSPSSKKRARRA